MKMDTKELINMELEKALKKATNPFLHYTERSDAATLVMMLAKAYGDERIHGLYLSTWRCRECGKLKHSTWMDRP